MKFRNIGRAAWAGAVSVGLVVGIAACGQDNTIDYLFVANAKNNPGQIDVYLVDGESGVLRQILDSPYPSGGTANEGLEPVSLVTTPNEKYMYALNRESNTIVLFAIGTDAKLYPENTYNTPGNSPTSMRVNAAGTYLYVVDGFQPQYNATSTGPGALVVYPINPDGTLGTPLTDGATGTPYYPVCNNPVDVTVLKNNNFIYVIDDPASEPPKIANTASSTAVGANGSSTITYTANGSCTADTGQMNAFSVGSGGGLTAVAGSPFDAGTAPTAIVSDATNSYVYVADYLNNDLLGYSVSGDGGLTPLSPATFSTGSGPNAVTISPNNSFMYVANYTGTLSAFNIASGGALTPLASTPNTAVNAGPTAVFIEPNEGKYLYTTGFVDNTVYGSEMNSTTGALSAVQNTPFSAAGQPTAIAAITHGRILGH